RHVTVDDFQSRGILVVGPSSAKISHNVVTGQGPSLLFQHGIDVRYGAVARITHNRVSGIIGTTIFHGPDPINQFQGAGISNSVNTVARLSGNRISGWSIAAVQEQTCAIFVCDPAFAGFTATAVVGKQ